MSHCCSPTINQVASSGMKAGPERGLYTGRQQNTLSIITHCSFKCATLFPLDFTTSLTGSCTEEASLAAPRVNPCLLQNTPRPGCLLPHQPLRRQCYYLCLLQQHPASFVLIHTIHAVLSSLQTGDSAQNWHRLVESRPAQD